jgi:hypothetical protein
VRGGPSLVIVQVIAYFAFGTLLLLRKTWAESGITYSYGLLHMSTLWMAALVLQSALCLHAAHNQLKDWDGYPLYSWSGSDTALIWATLIFAYILAVVYFVLFILLIIFRSAAQRIVLRGKPAVSGASARLNPTYTKA